MDLTIPYTFYPLALPHWMAWALFLTAITGGAVAGVVRSRRRGWSSGVIFGTGIAAGLLVATVAASMVMTFFIHDV